MFTIYLVLHTCPGFSLLPFFKKCFSTIIRINCRVFKNYHHLSPIPDIFIQLGCTWMWALVFFSNGQMELRITVSYSLPLSGRVSIYSQSISPPQPLTLLICRLTYPNPHSTSQSTMFPNKPLTHKCVSPPFTIYFLTC